MKSQPATALGICLAIFCSPSCATRSAAVPYVAKAEGAKTVQTYVASHGWHTALIILANSLNRQIPDLKSRFGTPAYYEVGWGDAEFYQAKKVTPSLTLHAAFCSSNTVVHVSTIPVSPCLSFPHSQISSVPLSQDQVDNMRHFIFRSLAHDCNGRVMPLRNGIYGESRFYLGSGHYSIINTCNNWTAKGLRSAGLKISPWSKFSSKSVMRPLEKSPTVAAATPSATSP